MSFSQFCEIFKAADVFTNSTAKELVKIPDNLLRLESSNRDKLIPVEFLKECQGRIVRLNKLKQHLIEQLIQA
jgi:hypothetical protein